MSASADDGRGGSAPPRPAAPRGSRQQWFVLGPWLFDVTAATELLHRVPRPVQPMPAGPWARSCGIIPGPQQPGTVPLIGPGPGFDPDYAMTTSLDDPVIIATITSPFGETAGLLLIDGTHRLYKAALLGRTQIPSLVLTPGETLAIRSPARPTPAAAARRRPARREPRR